MIPLKFHLLFFSLFVICSSCQKDTSKEQLKMGLEKIQSRNSSLLFEKDPTKIPLPFSFYQYFKDEYSESKYPSYEVNSSLADFLKTKNYNGESYKAFVLRSDDQFQYLVVDMSRGDSDYFILITTQNNKIIDHKEIGSIGDENPVTFKIFPDYTVEKYKGNTEDATAFEKFKIDQKGKIIKF